MVEFLDGEALLSCDYNVKSDGCHRVQWVKYTNGVRSILLARPKSLTFPDAERVGSRPDGNGTHSLYLTKLRQSDAGLYSCEIWSDWSRINVRNTTLIIKGEIYGNSQHSQIDSMSCKEMCPPFRVQKPAGRNGGAGHLCQSELPAGRDGGDPARSHQCLLGDGETSENCPSRIGKGRSQRVVAVLQGCRGAG